MAENKDNKQEQEPEQELAQEQEPEQEQAFETEEQPPKEQEVNAKEPLTKIYRCFFCGKCFRSQSELITHMRREHNG